MFMFVFFGTYYLHFLVPSRCRGTVPSPNRHQPGRGPVRPRACRARAATVPQPAGPRARTATTPVPAPQYINIIIKNYQENFTSVITQSPFHSPPSPQTNTYHSVRQSSGTKIHALIALIHSLHYMYHSIARWTARAPGGMAPGLRSARTACRARSLAT